MTRIPDESAEALDALRQFGGDELLRTLLETFLSFTEAQLAVADLAAADGDGAGIARVAHGLKSSARQMGAVALADACARTEEAGVGNADVPAAVAGVTAMRREFAAAQLWMRSLLAAASEQE